MHISQTSSVQRSAALLKKSAPGILDWFIIFVFAVIAFTCFDQAYDMKITMVHASDFLTCILNGKITHFYEFVMEKALAGGYYSADGSLDIAAYNILIYIVLSIWCLPLYFLNMAVKFERYDFLLNTWGRLLVIVLSMLCAYLIMKLARKFTQNSDSAKWMGYFFLSSPLFVFCVIIQDQFDIISVLLMISGLFFYFDKKYCKFSFLFSIAVCFKLFPLLVFFPLLLLAEKKMSKLFQYAVISIAPYIVTNYLSGIFDPGYHASQVLLKANFNFFERVYAAQIPGGAANISIFIVLFILICAVSYYITPAARVFPSIAFTLCCASCSSFFIFVEWHPQWFIIILPFMTLMVFSLKNFRFGVMLETFVTAAYLVTAGFKFFGAYMMRHSILVVMTQDTYVFSSALNQIYDGLNLIPSSSVFAAFLCALLLTSYKDIQSNRNEINYLDTRIEIERGLLYLRSSTILIYMLPPIIYYLSHRVA